MYKRQLLSAPASVAYACQLTDKQQPEPDALEPVWAQLLESPQWTPVLHQYPMLRQVRELMVHVDDLLAAV